MPFEGGEPRRLSVGPGHAITLVARGNRAIFTRFDEDGRQHIWRMNLDGSGLTQITNSSGEQLLDVSNDGRSFTFTRVDSARAVWVGSVETGKSVIVGGTSLGIGFFTQSGEHVLVVDLQPDNNGLVQTVFRLVPTAGGPEVAQFTQPPQAIDPSEGGPNEWAFLNRDDPARNVYLLKLGGTDMKQISKFADGRLTDQEWSHDRKSIAVVRRDDLGENVWIVDVATGAAKQVTKFDAQDVVQVKWTLDDKRVVVRAGTTSRDVVLISDFK